MASELDLYLDQGATKILTFEFTDDDDAPMPMTGYTFAAQVRPTTADVAGSPIAFSFDTSLASDGVITATLGATALNALTITGPAWTDPLEYQWDMEMTETATTIVTRLFNGRAFISPQVTK